MIHVTLSGGFALRVAGEYVPVRPVKARLLLACVALDPEQGRRRAELQALFWSNYPAHRAQANLRWTLHQLRASLPDWIGNIVHADREYVRLGRRDVSTDVLAMHEMAMDGGYENLAQAAALYRGAFLDDVTVADPEAHQWLLVERARFHDLAESLHWQLFSYCVWRRDLDSASIWARRWLDLDPDAGRMRSAWNRLATLRANPSAASHVGSVAPLVLGREHPTVPDSRPIVLVLPFADRDTDDPSDRTATALTDDLIFDLSRFRDIAVFARHTSRAVHNRRQVNALGAQYVVNGFVTRFARRVALRIYLTESSTGRVLLTEERVTAPERLAEARAHLAAGLASVLPAAVEDAELERLKGARECDTNAYEWYLMGRRRLESPREAGPAPGECFERCLELDPHFAAAHAGLAAAYFYGCSMLDGISWKRRLELAHESAMTAVRLDDTNARNHAILGEVLLLRREFDAVEPVLERIVSCNPNDAESLIRLAAYHTYLDSTDEAGAWVRRSMELNPHFPGSFAERAGVCAFAAGRPEEALGWLRYCADRILVNRLWMAVAAMSAHREDEAREHAVRLLHAAKRKIPPGERRDAGGISAWLNRLVTFRDPDKTNEFQALSARAGIR